MLPYPDVLPLKGVAGRLDLSGTDPKRRLNDFAWCNFVVLGLPKQAGSCKPQTGWSSSARARHFADDLLGEAAAVGSYEARGTLPVNGKRAAIFRVHAATGYIMDQQKLISNLLFLALFRFEPLVMFSSASPICFCCAVLHCCSSLSGDLSFPRIPPTLAAEETFLVPSSSMLYQHATLGFVHSENSFSTTLTFCLQIQRFPHL